MIDRIYNIARQVALVSLHVSAVLINRASVPSCHIIITMSYIHLLCNMWWKDNVKMSSDCDFSGSPVLPKF